MSEEADPFEAMVERSKHLTNSWWLVIVWAGCTVYSLGRSGMARPILGSVCLVLFAWSLWVALRPPRFDPFLRMLRERPLEITGIYVYEVHRYGAHAATWIGISLKNGFSQEVQIPRGEGPPWCKRLMATLPNAELLDRKP